MNIIKYANSRLNRNGVPIDYNVKKVEKNRVNLQYCNCGENLGDLLSPIVCDYMLSNKNLNSNSNVAKTKHLFAIGSIIDFGYQDATIWGSGVLNDNSENKIIKGRRRGRKLDIRAVRGPNTRKLLLEAGYKCPEIYGDPAIIMPLIYNPNVEKKYGCSVICHASGKLNYEYFKENKIHIIDIKTTDYEEFIKQIKQSEKIISSSLHGIILAETYNVPAVFVAKETRSQMLKFYDWYESTGRRNFLIASSFEQALITQPVKLPQLDAMREQLMSAFPYDIYR